MDNTIFPLLQYCPACGQQKIEGRMTIKKAGLNFLHTYSGTDRGFIYTLTHLLILPGSTIRNYLGGQRKPYTQPLQFYLITLTLFFLSSVLLNVNPMDMSQGIGQTELSEKANVQGLYAQLSSNLKVIYTIFIPLMALSYLLFYRKQGYNFTELLVFSLVCLWHDNVIFHTSVDR